VAAALRARGLWPSASSHGPARETRYELRDAAGALVAIHRRLDCADGTKTFAWQLPDGTPGLGGLPVANLPLYRSETLSDTAGPVVLVEGEKTCDALRARGVVAVATVTGAAATPGDEALGVLLGRPVLLWPDNDAAGAAHMRRIAQRLRALGHGDVRLVRWAAAPAGGDAADYCATHGDDDLRALLDGAEPWAPTGDATGDDPIPVLVPLAKVQPEPVLWLWPGRVPLGKLTVLDGDPGMGKSLVTLDLAARVSTGRPMPDGSRADLPGPAGVVLLSAEDDLADTVRPRLDAAGADCSRIVALPAIRVPDGAAARERMPHLGDIAALRAAIKHADAKLVIVDPLMAYVAADAHVDADVRSRLAPLANLVAEMGAAIVLVRHLTKGGGGQPLYRGGGSIGIIAAARAGLLVAPDPDDPEGRRRVLAVTKDNLAELPPALVYRIDADAHGVPRIAWLGETTHTATQLLAAPAGDDERSALDEAKRFLRDLLADGPVAADAVWREARRADIAEATLRRAKAALRVEAVRVGGFGAAGCWLWRLPEQASEQLKAIKNCLGDHPSRMIALGEGDRLSSAARPVPGDDWGEV
jgi:hypothetical protein